MSIDVQAEISISRPQEAVAEFIFDPKNDRLWMTGYSKVFPLQAGPLAVGGRVERIGSFLNRQFSAIHHVTAIDPGRSVEMTTDEPFSMKLRYEVEGSDGGSVVRLRIQSFGELLFKVPIPIFRKAVDEKLNEELRRLKKHLEQ